MKQPRDISRIVPGLDDLQQRTSGHRDICIAVLDGPARLEHPCFKGADVTTLQTLVPADDEAGPMAVHGTHVASVLFGQPGSAVRGIAPGCRGLILPVFSDARKGPLSQLDLARAIQQAVEAGAHIINISGGELSPSAEADQMLVNAVNHCHEQNVLIVAAAGNDGCRCLHVPAALPAVLAVGAADAQGQPLASSNWGDAYAGQGILAPGSNIPGAGPGGDLLSLSGTSFATPVVSGVAALLLSLQLEQGHAPDPRSVRDAFLTSALRCEATPGRDCSRFLAGTLNIPGALAILDEGGPMHDSDDSPEVNRPGPSGPDTAAAPPPVRPAAASPGVSASSRSADSADSAATGDPAAGDLAAEPGAEPSADQHATELRPAMPAAPVSSDAAGPSIAAASVLNVSAEPQGDHVTSPTTTVSPSVAAVEPSSVAPSESCGCDSRGKPLVFALGSIDYDFGTEARRDSFRQLMETPQRPVPSPHDPTQMVEYLESDPSESAHLIWTLNIELTPVYAIVPEGPYAEKMYENLLDALRGQIRPTMAVTEGDDIDPHRASVIERVSVPGYLNGKTVTLFSGQVVPVLVPQLRGFFSWDTKSLVDAALAAAGLLGTVEPPQPFTETPVGGIIPSADMSAAEREDQIRRDLRDFLNRIYFDLRNLGQTPQERALNFAATNAFRQAQAFSESVERRLQLDDIGVERSPFCRVDSDCWDVRLTFFDPENTRRARRVFRYTIDVSDVMPVTVGDMRSWAQS